VVDLHHLVSILMCYILALKIYATGSSLTTQLHNVENHSLTVPAMRFSNFTYSDILALQVFLPKTSEQFSTKFSHMINAYISFLIYLRQKKHENLITCQIFHLFNMFLLQSLFNFPFVDCTVLARVPFVTNSLQLIQRVPYQRNS
jgi:hypothetical protein